jgi:general L-amino acid transport system permease protein
MKENLFGGDTQVAVFFNGLLTVVFALLALNIVRFLPSYIFNPERRWSAVTSNMQLMMAQAFPQADLHRIWLSIGIFFVLVGLSIVAWGLSGRISLFKLAGGIRSAGVFLMLLTIMHGAFEADLLINLPLLRIDSPTAWSGGRLMIFLIGAVLVAGSYFYLKRYRAAAKESTAPFLSVLVAAMAVITAIIWTVKLPVPEGQFEETIAPIARTTTGPWTILFLVAIAGYFIGKWLITVVDPALFKRLVVFGWVFSYPIIIMIIQRKPILEWGEILSLSNLDSPLMLFLLFTILGGAVLWWLALPENLVVGKGIAAGIGAAIIIAAWFVIPEIPAWTKVVATLFALGLIAGAALVHDRLETARIIGSGLAPMALLVWFIPMPFIVRTLAISFVLVAIAAPSFGGTAPARLRLIIVWTALVALVMGTFVLGEAETALEFQSTTFLGGFNLSILLAISGVVLSFPLGIVLALARTSTMPIFRLIATGYIELVRSVPLITWLFFGSVMLALFLPSGVEFDEIVRIVAAISIFSAAYVAENVRGGLQSIGKGQYEAARAMGLSTVQSTSLIILPQAIRAVLPALVGSIIVSFKDTSLVAIIGLADVLLIAKSFVPGQSNPNFQGTQAQMLFFIAIFYWVFTFTFSRLSLRYEKSLGLGER